MDQRHLLFAAPLLALGACSQPAGVDQAPGATAAPVEHSAFQTVQLRLTGLS